MIERDIHAKYPTKYARMIDNIGSQQDYCIAENEKIGIFYADRVDERYGKGSKEIGDFSFWECFAAQCYNREYRKKSKPESHTHIISRTEENIDDREYKYIK